jgi:(p)ppGpp synthase/HD superfamily hydrolase
MDSLDIFKITDPNELYRRLKEKLDLKAEEEGALDRAYDLAAKCHDGQLRDEGTPYILHPLRVALILRAELGIEDIGLISAALLHDVLEDSAITKAEVEAAVGERVARMVDVMTKRPLANYASQDERSLHYHSTILHSPREVKLIKLADRLDNVRGLHLSPYEDKKLRYLEWTRDKLLPMAKETDEYLYLSLANWCRKFENQGSGIVGQQIRDQRSAVEDRRRKADP